MNAAARAPRWEFLSALPGLAWPALPGPEGNALLSVLEQLEASQWLAPDALRERQYRQLDLVLRHAWESVPYYRESWAGRYDPARPLCAERFAALPLLARRSLQSEFERLKSAHVPAAHGPVGIAHSSGSTGTPVRVLKTTLSLQFWRALTLREHRWHRRDLGAKLASIRLGTTPGDYPGWGGATADLVRTGPLAVLGVDAGVDEQLRWLEREAPAYLLTYPSNAAALAARALELELRLPSLREVRTLGETLAPQVRGLCRKAWEVPVADMYSTEEAGYIALQCPSHEHYHVQSEDVLVEILDDEDRPCEPGRSGRVVVTTLHNFAMPLVRYELGDFAEAAAPCPCGRGLPVLRRILGRVRNMLVTASGERYWPALRGHAFTEVAPVTQFQLVQKSVTLVEARLVVAAPLSPAQEEALRLRILSLLPPGFTLGMSYHERIPRGAGGKYEDFVSELV